MAGIAEFLRLAAPVSLPSLLRWESKTKREWSMHLLNRGSACCLNFAGESG
jgi:hypothetical protein